MSVLLRAKHTRVTHDEVFRRSLRTKSSDDWPPPSAGEQRMIAASSTGGASHRRPDNGKPSWHLAAVSKAGASGLGDAILHEHVKRSRHILYSCTLCQGRVGVRSDFRVLSSLSPGCKMI